MIEVYDLNILLNNYGIDISKVLDKNTTIVDKGYYYEIEKTLKYLINDLGISTKNIEKCPSILYLNTSVIESNYNFLIETNLYPNDINTCLHILSTEPRQLRETYYYVYNNYGIEMLRKTTTILRVEVERIQEIENRFSHVLNKNNIISASISRRTIEEIERIIAVCRQNNIELTGSVFHKPAEEIERIIAVCRQNKIEITGNVFQKPAEEIERIIAVCRQNNIEITGNVFLKPAEEIERIIAVCRQNNIEITGSVFLKPADKIEQTIKFLLENYSSDYLKPLIINKKITYLEKVFPYLDSLNLLPYVIVSASILTLTLDEIIERKEFIESIGEPLVTPKNRFNSIFGLSRKRYQEKKEQYKKGNSRK